MMIEFIFAIAIALFAHDAQIDDFVYVEYHDITQSFDYDAFEKTLNACYENNDTSKTINECIDYAINSYTRNYA